MDFKQKKMHHKQFRHENFILELYDDQDHDIDDESFE